MQTHEQPVMTPLLTFGECVRQLLEARKMSASELARRMNYKSRNTIFRILEDAGAHSARHAFFVRLNHEDPLMLTDTERVCLSQALELSRVGRDAFVSNCAMRNLLLDREQADYAVRVECADRASDDFERAIYHLPAEGKLQILITGCCDRAIFDWLRRILVSPERKVSVEVKHLIYAGEESIVSSIAAIQPLLYTGFYSAYCAEPGAASGEREQIYRSNLIMVRGESTETGCFGQTFVLMDKGVFCPLRSSENGLDDPLLNCLLKDIEGMKPLKMVFDDVDSLESYIGFTESCRKMEMGRAAYTIKPDVPVCFIHPDIIYASAMEGYAAIGPKEEAEIKAIAPELIRIHALRWENYFTKRRSNHTVFCRAAMERFARTGMQSDHFFVLRPYTPQERVSILENLRQQEQINPHFHIHFFKDEFAPTGEISLFEGAGTLMAKPYTHYNLAEDHAEAFITQSAFCERYKAFYVKDLLVRHVHTHEETLRILDELIEIARGAAE